ncbi:MAG: hypothetical protein M0R40_01580 [Firmicutes bacterium]|nr:hypothetical protein [Bacillota bacterium]
MKKFFAICLICVFICAGCKSSEHKADYTEKSKYYLLYLELLEPIFGDYVERYDNNNDLLVKIRKIEKDEKWLKMQDILWQLKQMWLNMKENEGSFIISIMVDNNDVQRLIEFVNMCDGTGADTIEKMTEKQRYGLGITKVSNRVNYDSIKKNMEQCEKIWQQ